MYIFQKLRGKVGNVGPAFLKVRAAQKAKGEFNSRQLGPALDGSLESFHEVSTKVVPVCLTGNRGWSGNGLEEVPGTKREGGKGRFLSLSSQARICHGVRCIMGTALVAMLIVS